MTQVEQKPASSITVPAETRVTFTFSELIAMVRKEVHQLPEGGTFVVKVNPDTERVTIIHT